MGPQDVSFNKKKKKATVMNIEYSIYHLWEKGENEIYRHTYLPVWACLWMEPQEAGDTGCLRGGEAGGWGWVGGRILTVFLFVSF